MDKATKIILNSLRCPLCASQIDMFQDKRKVYNYSCSSVPEHYRIQFHSLGFPAGVLLESVTIYEGSHQYEIIQNHFTDIKTDIIMKSVDPEFRIIDKVSPKIFTYKKVLFDFQNTNKEKILNRVKTILVFQ
jgi:hypothetical protein